MDNTILLEEQKKRFNQILEFTYRGNRHSMYEADNEQPQDNGEDMMGGDPNMGGGMPPQGDNPNMGGNPNMDGGMPPQGGEDMMGGDPNMGGGMPPQDNQQGGVPGFNPQDNSMGGDMSQSDFEDETPGPNDDVVDISDLTDAQESTEDAVKEVGSKFDKVLKYLGQWEEMIKSNNEKIEDLKAEFEKRNPTQLEKLGMQTARSYPFNITPEEYWKDKEQTSNYRIEDDNNGKEQGQYVITKDDIDGTTNWKGISDSLDDDAIYHPTLKNTMGYGL